MYYKTPTLLFGSISKSIFYSSILTILVSGLLYSLMEKKGYADIIEINQNLDNYVELVLGSLIFTILGLFFIYLFERSLLTNLDKLQDMMKRSNDSNPWYKSFIRDVSRKIWYLYFLIVVIIGTILHYYLYGYLIVEAFGWVHYILSLILLLYPNFLVGTWTGWLMIAQLFHIYLFSKSEDELSIGWDSDTKLGNRSTLRNKIARKFLPINISPSPVYFEYQNPDKLGGLEPLFKISFIGIILLSRLFAVLVPLWTTANRSSGLVLLMIFLFIMIISYNLAFYSLRRVIRFEKKIHLEKYNIKIINIESLLNSNNDDKTENILIDELSDFKQIYNQIENIHENPRSIIIIWNLLFSMALPFISYLSIIRLLYIDYWRYYIL